MNVIQFLASVLTGISKRRRRIEAKPATEEPETASDSKIDVEQRKMRTLECGVVVPDIEAEVQQTNGKPEFCEEMEWEPIEQEKIAEEVIAHLQLENEILRTQ